MRYDGDEYRRHDDECSDMSPCAECEPENELCCAADGWGDMPHAKDCRAAVPTDRLGIQMDTARDVWQAVLDLIASGTPMAGIAAIGKRNIEGYEAFLLARKKGE